MSIGPVTSSEARDAGLEVVAEAESHDLDGLVAAVSFAASPRPVHHPPDRLRPRGRLRGTCVGVIKRVAPDVESRSTSRTGSRPSTSCKARSSSRARLPVHAGRCSRHGTSIRGRAAGGSRSSAGRRQSPLRRARRRLLLVARGTGSAAWRSVEIAEAAYMLDRIYPHVHGHDIFSPATAHLASGVELAELGPALRPGRAADRPVPRAVHRRSTDPGHRPLRRSGPATCGSITAEHLPVSEVTPAAGRGRGSAASATSGRRAHLRGRTWEHRSLYEDAYANVPSPSTVGTQRACSPCGSSDELRLTPA